MQENIVDLKSVFTNLPGSNVLILPDVPVFTIVAVSKDYLQDTERKSEELMGKGLFEVFPNNPEDPNQTSEKTVRASLEYALRHKDTHYLSIQRYDIPNSEGVYEERFWTANNKPVLNEKGEVVYLIHHVEEVTEKIKAEKREAHLKSIEKVFGLVMEAPEIISFLKGEDLIVELANAGALKLWGKASDVFGKPLLQVLPEIEGQGIIELLHQVLHSGKPYMAKEEPVISSVNGKNVTKYFDRLYQPYFADGSTKALGVFTLSHDVTELVEARLKVEAAQKEVERQKRLYEAINGSIPDLVYVFDLSYRFTYANKALLEMWGKSWEQSIGKGLLENGYEPWHAEMHEREIDQVAATKQPIRGEASFPHATLGKRIYDYIFVPVFNEKGEVEAVAGTTRDITEMRRAEQIIKLNEAQLQRKVDERTRELEDQKDLLNNILQNSSNGISVSQVFRDNSGNVIDARTILANEAAVKNVGLPKDIYLSKRATEIEPGIIGSPYYQQCIKTLQTGEPFLTQYQMQSNGRWLELTVSKLDDDHLIHIFTDVTPIKEAQLQLERTVRELRRSNNYLEDFAHAASHDLKEPLRKIRTFTDRLKVRMAGRLDETEADLYNRIQVSAERMQILVDDLLEFSHVNNSTQTFESINLNDKLQKVLTDLELPIEEKGATVTVGPLPIVQGNRRQLQQLFQNLISNALKYSKPDTTPEIIVRSRKVHGSDVPVDLPEQRTNQSFHLIEISDNGIGFEQQYAEKIFEMFQRLHGKAEYSGTGVGLSIARKVVENHNGYIWAEGQLGEGATFKVLLPAN